MSLWESGLKKRSPSSSEWTPMLCTGCGVGGGLWSPCGRPHTSQPAPTLPRRALRQRLSSGALCTRAPPSALGVLRAQRSPSLASVQVNDWQKDWVAFYTQQRIQPQMDMVEKASGDREALELWSALQVRGAPPLRGAAAGAAGAVKGPWVWTGGGWGVIPA